MNLCLLEYLNQYTTTEEQEGELMVIDAMGKGLAAITKNVVSLLPHESITKQKLLPIHKLEST